MGEVVKVDFERRTPLKVIRARTNRGPCATCLRDIVPGDRYVQTTRFLTEKEYVELRKSPHSKRPYILPGNKIAIVLHEGCPHPRGRTREEEKNAVDRGVFSQLCRDGRVPKAGGGQGVCPACEGRGCR